MVIRYDDRDHCLVGPNSHVAGTVLHGGIVGICAEIRVNGTVRLRSRLEPGRHRANRPGGGRRPGPMREVTARLSEWLSVHRAETAAEEPD